VGPTIAGKVNAGGERVFQRKSYFGRWSLPQKDCYNLRIAVRPVCFLESSRASKAFQAAPNPASGQVAQVVERSPEKAGVGGSSPSLATIILKSLAASLPGVFAVGDIRAESVKRVASAVGEGSMAVHFVHKVLAE
jgi:hypothetical protein